MSNYLSMCAIAMWLCLRVGEAAERPALGEPQLQERVIRLQAERNEAEKLSQANQLIRTFGLTSLQVKTMAVALGDDSTRLEFATAAYPHTLDPENYYLIFDSFSFSSSKDALSRHIESKRRPPKGGPGR